MLKGVSGPINVVVDFLLKAPLRIMTLGVEGVLPTDALMVPATTLYPMRVLQHTAFCWKWARALFVCARAGAAISRLEAAIKTATNSAPPMRIP
jgi:hypothetical protein